MHDYLQFSMSDVSFSLTNYLFFIYHSWIDAELELKIRKVRNLKNAAVMGAHLTKPVGLNRSNFKGIKNKDYPIMEWADVHDSNVTNFKYKSFFTAGDFIM
jgi:hypothetical protein